MRNTLVIMLVCVSLVCGNTVLAAASAFPHAANSEQTFPEDPDLEQLREAVRRLEEKDKDPNLSPGVKAMNRQFLDQRRQALLTSLRTTLDSLRQYQTEMKSQLTAAESRSLESKAQSYEQEIQSLSSGTAGTTADTRPLRAEPVPAAPRVQPEAPRATDTAGNPTVRANQAGAAPSQTGASGPGLSTVPPSKLTDGTQTGTMKLTSADLQPCAQFDQTKPGTFSLLSKYVCRAAGRITERKRTDSTVGFNQDENLFLLALVMIAKMDRPAVLLESEEARTDKQVGAGPSASGSTSLTVKGGVPSVLGLAVENGALAQSVSGTTITFRGNPYGIAQALAQKGFIQSYDESQKYAVTKFLKNSSFSFSFDTSRGNPAGTNVFTGDKQQLSALSFRYVFIDHRDPRRPEYTAAWEKFLADEGEKFAGAADAAFAALYTSGRDPNFKDPALRQWAVDTNAAIVAANGNKVEEVLKQRLGTLPIDSLSPDTVDSLKRLRTVFGGYVTARNQVLDTVAKGTIVSVEYTNNREVNSPDLSNITFIAQKGMGGRFDGTLNGSITFFNKLPVGMTRRVRDFNFSGEGDIALGDVRGIGNLVLSFSGRYERLQENSMTPDGMVMMNTKGDLVFGQAKLTIPVKGLGAKIPISFTVSNRTELIKEKEVKGNIGFTFDLDTIFAKFKP